MTTPVTPPPMPGHLAPGSTAPPAAPAAPVAKPVQLARQLKVQVKLHFWPVMTTALLLLLLLVLISASVVGWAWTGIGAAVLVALVVLAWYAVRRLRAAYRRRTGTGRTGTAGAGGIGTRTGTRSPFAAVRSRMPSFLGGTRPRNPGGTGAGTGWVARHTPGTRGAAARARYAARAGTGSPTAMGARRPGGGTAGGGGRGAYGGGRTGSRSWRHPLGGTPNTGGGTSTDRTPTGTGRSPNRATDTTADPAKGKDPAAPPPAPKSPEAPVTEPAAPAPEPTPKPKPAPAPSTTHGGGIMDVSIKKLVELWKHAPDQVGPVLDRVAELARHTAEDHVTGSAAKQSAERIGGLARALLAELRAAPGQIEADLERDLSRAENHRTSLGAELRADVAAQHRDT